MKKDLNLSTLQKEEIVSCVHFSAVFGALIGGQISKMYGRRTGMRVAAILYIIGPIVMAATDTVAVIMFGRCILGLAIGIGAVISPVYIAEISPANIRGALITFDEIFINIGIVFGFFLGYVLFFTNDSNSFRWRFMVVFGSIFGVILLVAIQFIPESPRFLIGKLKYEQARLVLNTIVLAANDDQTLV
jgi:MFS family permease